MSRVPRKVRAAAAAAERLIEEGLQEPTPVEAEEPAPEPVVEQPETEIQQESKAEETQPEVVASPEPESIPEPVGDEEKWEQRYKALQGKYNAEVPRLNAELKELREKVGSVTESNLQAEIASLKAQLQEQPAPTPVASPVIDKIRDDYGNELADAFAFQQAENDQLKQQISDLMNQTHQIQSVNSLDTFARMLGEQGINFEQQNNDPLFIDWLGEVDSFSGLTKQQMLTQAFEAGDLQRAAQFFVAYAGQTSTKTEPKPAPSMDDQVRVASTAAPKEDTASDQPAWTQDQIREFYRNKTAGAYSPEEAQRLENQLFAALRG